LKIISKIFLIFIFPFTVIVFSQPDNQHQETSIQNLVSKINDVISDSLFQQTLIAIDIFDLSDSLSLYKKNEKLLLRPASNMKILTSVTGLINLGVDYKFKTELYHSGVIDGETLYGDLYVGGGFDPDFTTSDLDSLVQIVKLLRIKEINGRIYGDISKKDSLYWGKGWMWDDDPDASAPYLSALNINGNTIEVFVEPGEVGYPAKLTLIPQTDYVKVINNSVTVSPDLPDNFKITRDWVNRTNTIIVNGDVRSAKVTDSSAYTEQVNLLNPERYFLTLFKEHLEIAGIKVKNGIDVRKVERNSVYLASIQRDIDTVLSDLNKESDNLNAEMLVYAIALEDSGSPAQIDNGLVALNRIIDSLGLKSENYLIADGSGVSHYNLISTELLLEALKFIYYERKDLLNLFYNSLAVAGIDGTLERRMKNTSAEGNVHAKTGTINGVSNLSGYVTAQNGHLIAFSIMIQNFVEDYSTARNIQDKICILLAEYE